MNFQVKTAKVSFPTAEWDSVSPDAKDLITKLLVKNPTKRSTAEHALRHRWFQLAEKQDGSVPREINPRKSHFGIELLEKFRRFQGLSRLKKIALTIMAQHIDEEEIAGNWRKVLKQQLIIVVDHRLERNIYGSRHVW